MTVKKEGIKLFKQFFFLGRESTKRSKKGTNEKNKEDEEKRKTKKTPRKTKTVAEKKEGFLNMR